MLFEGGLNSKAGWATGVTVNLEECPETKHLKVASCWFPLSVCGGEQIGPLRGLSDNKHFTGGPICICHQWQ